MKVMSAPLRCTPQWIRHFGRSVRDQDAREECLQEVGRIAVASAGKTHQEVTQITAYLLRRSKPEQQRVQPRTLVPHRRQSTGAQVVVAIRTWTYLC